MRISSGAEGSGKRNGATHLISRVTDVLEWRFWATLDFISIEAEKRRGAEIQRRGPVSNANRTTLRDARARIQVITASSGVAALCQRWAVHIMGGPDSLASVHSNPRCLVNATRIAPEP